MKFFVTGGTGFIGSHFLRVALGSGHEVTAIRRKGSQPCIPLEKEPHWLEKPMDEISADDLTGFDAFVHLASVGVSPKVATWDELFYWNVTVLLKLLQQAKVAKVPRTIVAGSFIEYGTSGDRFDRLPTDAPLLPTSGYAASKAAGSVLCSAFAIENQMDLTYLRIFSAYGEGQFEKSFWPALRAAAQSGSDFSMTPGEQVRDYIPVTDVAEAILTYAIEGKSSSPGAKFVNLGTGNPISMREFGEGWWKAWGATGTLHVGAIPYRPNEAMRFAPLMQGAHSSPGETPE